MQRLCCLRSAETCGKHQQKSRHIHRGVTAEKKALLTCPRVSRMLCGFSGRSLGTSMHSASAYLTATASMFPPTVLTFRFGRPTAPPQRGLPEYLAAWKRPLQLGAMGLRILRSQRQRHVNGGFSRRSVAVRSMVPPRRRWPAARRFVNGSRDRSAGDVTKVLPATRTFGLRRCCRRLGRGVFGSTRHNNAGRCCREVRQPIARAAIRPYHALRKARA